MMPIVGLNRTGKTVTHKTVTHKTVTDKTSTIVPFGRPVSHFGRLPDAGCRWTFKGKR
jgi:hypothetical protein